jgi:hypothetical protein
VLPIQTGRPGGLLVIHASRLTGAAILSLVLDPAIAHHSRAHFDLDSMITIDGIVTEVSWRSPHVYYEVQTVDAIGNEQHWTLEGHSIPGFLRMGWNPDTLEVGDAVVVVAHPNRNPDKTFAMLYSATLADGVVHYAYALPEGVTDPNIPDRSPTAPSTDFSGTWRHIIPVREATIGSFRAPTEWPLTARGRAQVERFDINDDPMLDCVPMGVPRLILATYSHRWTRYDDRIVIEKERSPQVRIIHLDIDAPPADFEPSDLGFSTGHFEPDGTLVVTTTGFVDTRWGSARGLDSSAAKRVVERYRLIDGGYGISVQYTIDDPEFLAEPVTVTGDYRKSADFEFVDETCDPAVARRHLSF